MTEVELDRLCANLRRMEPLERAVTAALQVGAPGVSGGACPNCGNPLQIVWRGALMKRWCQDCGKYV